MNILYKILFTIDISHDYYASGPCTDFDIIPTEDTIRIFERYDIKYRQLNNQLIALVKAETATAPGGVIFHKPYIEFEEPIKFAFYLKLKNFRFGNFTNLPYRPGGGKVLYLSNLSNNKLDTNLYLSGTMPRYNSANAYLPGNLVEDGARRVFESINKIPAGITDPLTAVHLWKESPANRQYVSVNDITTAAGAVFSCQLPAPLAEVPVKVSELDVVASTAAEARYTKTIFNKTLRYSQPVDAVQVNTLAAEQPFKLQPGRYEVKIGAAPAKKVYVDDALIAAGYYGVVELFNFTNLSADYKLLGADNKIVGKAFAIRFKNRSTIWKYISAQSLVTNVTDDNFDFEPLGVSTFYSTTPIPLSDKPIDSISADWNAGAVPPRTGTLAGLRNAGIDFISRIKIPAPQPTPPPGGTPEQVEYDCSEIFLNI